MSDSKEYPPLGPLTIEQFEAADVVNSQNVEEYPNATGELPHLNPDQVEKMVSGVNKELKKGDFDLFPDADHITVHEVLGLLDMFARMTSDKGKKSLRAKEFLVSEVYLPWLCVPSGKGLVNRYRQIADSANERFRYYYPEDKQSLLKNGRLTDVMPSMIFTKLGKFVRSCFEHDAFTQEAWNEIDGYEHITDERNPDDRNMPPPAPTVPPEKATPLLTELSPDAEPFIRATHAFTRLLDLDVEQFKALAELLNPNRVPIVSRADKRQEVGDLLRLRFNALPISHSLDPAEPNDAERQRVGWLIAEEDLQPVYWQVVSVKNAGGDTERVKRELFSGLSKMGIKLRKELDRTSHPKAG